VLYATVSGYWGAGGTALPGTVGGTLERASNSHHPPLRRRERQGAALARIPVGPVVPAPATRAAAQRLGLTPRERSQPVTSRTQSLSDRWTMKRWPVRGKNVAVTSQSAQLSVQYLTSAAAESGGKM